jgi:GTP-binding protein
MLLFRAAELLAEIPPPDQEQIVPVYKLESDPREFSIERLPAGWRVKGAAIERAAAMTYWEYEASIRRFQKILQALGIDAALRQAGIQEGDTVLVGDFELEWRE